MQDYDPLGPLDPQEWLALEELEQLRLVMDHHRRARVGLPRARRHLHAVVENQVAAGDELPVKRKLDQLMQERRDRHEAVHAIASVLINHISGPNCPRMSI